MRASANAMAGAGSTGRAPGARWLSDIGDLAGLSTANSRRSSPERTPKPRHEDFGRLVGFPESVAVFGKPDKTLWREGDRLIQGDLAATLDRIAEAGPEEFYTGRTAELIVSYMSGHGGLVAATT